MLRKAAASAVTAAALAAGSASAACDDVKKAEADFKKAEADFKKAAKKPDPKSMAELQLGLATKQRRVFVTSGIDDESAKVVIQQLGPNPHPHPHPDPDPNPNPKHSPTPNKVVIQQLIHLEEAEPGAPISMHIMSGGGKVYAGLAILDVMRSLTSPVHTTCLGHCESMAAVLLTLHLTLTLRTLG